MIKLLLQRRYLLTTVPKATQIVSQRVIIPPVTHFKQNCISKPIPRDDYKQLPDDSNFIENYYTELELFQRDYLQKELKKTYNSFENDPDELIFQLEKFVELHILPQYSIFNNKTLVPSNKFYIPRANVYCNYLGDKITVERYLDFIHAVRLTLRLNGGHPFIFSVLLKAKAVFDQLERSTMNKSL